MLGSFYDKAVNHRVHKVLPMATVLNQINPLLHVLPSDVSAICTCAFYVVSLSVFSHQNPT